VAAARSVAVVAAGVAEGQQDVAEVVARGVAVAVAAEKQQDAAEAVARSVAAEGRQDVAEEVVARSAADAEGRQGDAGSVARDVRDVVENTSGSG